jgi:hypothetical protein
MSAIKTKKKAIPKVVKDLSWNKWIGDDVAKTKCLCCCVNEIKMNTFHCGHVIAEANGGSTTVDNLRPICSACNLSMGTENMNTFKNKCGFDKKVEPVPEPKVESKVEKINKLLSLNKRRAGISEYTKCPGKMMCHFDDNEKHCKSCNNHYSVFCNNCPCKDI